jgi:hypothetical protein
MVLVLHIEHAVSKKYNIMKRKFKQWWSNIRTVWSYQKRVIRGHRSKVIRSHKSKVIRSHKSKVIRSHKSKVRQWPKDKQQSTKHYTEYNRSSNTNPTKNREWTQVLRKSGPFLLHMWHLSCYYCYKPGDKSRMRKGPDCDDDKWNISVVICDIDIL